MQFLQWIKRRYKTAIWQTLTSLLIGAVFIFSGIFPPTALAICLTLGFSLLIDVFVLNRISLWSTPHSSLRFGDIKDAWVENNSLIFFLMATAITLTLGLIALSGGTLILALVIGLAVASAIVWWSHHTHINPIEKVNTLASENDFGITDGILNINSWLLNANSTSADLKGAAVSHISEPTRKQGQQLVDAGWQIICRMTMRIPQDPVYLQLKDPLYRQPIGEKQVFERSYINAWLAFHRTHPITFAPCTQKDLQELTQDEKTQLREFRKQQPQAAIALDSASDTPSERDLAQSDAAKARREANTWNNFTKDLKDFIATNKIPVVERESQIALAAATASTALLPPLQSSSADDNKSPDGSPDLGRPAKMKMQPISNARAAGTYGALGNGGGSAGAGGASADVKKTTGGTEDGDRYHALPPDSEAAGGRKGPAPPGHTNPIY